MPKLIALRGSKEIANIRYILKLLEQEYLP